LPSVRNRDDPEAAALKQSMNPGLVLAALDELVDSEVKSPTSAEPKVDPEVVI
jgi:hypothetical protein